MSLFLETIKINNGRRINLDGHSRRMNYCRNRHFHEIRNIDLRDHIKVPSSFKKNIVKCRVTYGRKIERVVFEKYHFRQPTSFKIVEGNHLNYQYKAADRSALHELYENRGNCDDIIIIKDGLLTDSYYANLAFLKNGKWYTPTAPLLAGTQRKKLLDNGTLIAADINLATLQEYESFRIYNALTEWTMCNRIPINCIER